MEGLKNFEPLRKDIGLTINLELLPYCNFDCPYCYEHIKAKFTNSMNLQHLGMLNKAFRNSSHDLTVYLMGGEPTYSPYILKFIEKFKANPRIKKLGMYTNASRDMTKFKDLGLTIKMSYHPTETDDNVFIKNLNTLENENVEVHILMVHSKEDKIRKFYNKIKDRNIFIKPTYIYKPTSEYVKNIRRVPVRDKMFDFEDVLEFNVDGTNVSRHDILYNKLNYLKDCTCYPTRYCINNIGNICQSCGTAIDNIFRNNNYFRDLKINPWKCENIECSKDMFMEQVKFF